MDFNEIDLSNFQPMGNRLLVKRFEYLHPSLVIPEVLQAYSKTAEVIAVGPKVREVRKGDVVYLPGIALEHPDWEKDDCALITENDVAGVLDPGGNA